MSIHTDAVVTGLSSLLEVRARYARRTCQEPINRGSGMKPTSLAFLTLCLAGTLSMALVSDAQAARAGAYLVQKYPIAVDVISDDGKDYAKIPGNGPQFWMSLSGRCKTGEKFNLGYVTAEGYYAPNTENFTQVYFPADANYGPPTTAPIPTGIVPNGFAWPSSWAKRAVDACNANLVKQVNQHGMTTAQVMAKSWELPDVFLTKVEGGVACFNPGILSEPDYGPAISGPSTTVDAKMKVVCKRHGFPAAPVAGLAAAPVDFKPLNIKLFLATYLNNDGPNPATQCRALKVTTRVQTTKAGGVDVRLWRQEGDGAITNEFKSGYASFDAAKNGYFADFVTDEKVDSTTYLQYMAEVVGGTFAPSTPWKDITVHCTGAGGGLAGAPQNDPDKPKASWAGEVTVAENYAAKKSCPRQGKLSFFVTRNEPGTFKYKIGCSNGQGFDGSVPSYIHDASTLQASGGHSLHINRTRNIQCTLQEVKENGARVTIDQGSFDYSCNNPVIDLSVDGLAIPTTPPKPNQAQGVPNISTFCKPGFKLVGQKCVTVTPPGNKIQKPGVPAIPPVLGVEPAKPGVVPGGARVIKRQAE